MIPWSSPRLVRGRWPPGERSRAGWARWARRSMRWCFPGRVWSAVWSGRAGPSALLPPGSPGEGGEGGDVGLSALCVAGRPVRGLPSGLCRLPGPHAGLRRGDGDGALRGDLAGTLPAAQARAERLAGPLSERALGRGAGRGDRHAAAGCLDRAGPAALAATLAARLQPGRGPGSWPGAAGWTGRSAGHCAGSWRRTSSPSCRAPSGSRPCAGLPRPAELRSRRPHDRPGQRRPDHRRHLRRRGPRARKRPAPGGSSSPSSRGPARACCRSLFPKAPKGGGERGLESP